MSIEFENGLRAHLDGKRRLTLREKRIKKILDAKPSKARAAFLDNLQKTAADSEGMRAAAIDWGSFDWDKFFAMFMKFLEAILKLFA